MPERRRGAAPVAMLVAAVVALVADGASIARGDERVAITATDGVQLVGHLDGREGPGIVFVHGYRYDQRSWTAFATAIAQSGFRTLTFDFRGYGDSGGAKDVGAIDRDVEGAYRFVLGRKIRPVYLVGASMGGVAALVVAARVPVAGVATLSAPAAFERLDAVAAVAKLTAPALFVAADDDTAAADAARQFAARTSGPKTLQLVPGTEHGTALLDGPQSAAVKQALRTFLSEPSAR